METFFSVSEPSEPLPTLKPCALATFKSKAGSPSERRSLQSLVTPTGAWPMGHCVEGKGGPRDPRHQKSHPPQAGHTRTVTTATFSLVSRTHAGCSPGSTTSSLPRMPNMPGVRPGTFPPSCVPSLHWSRRGLPSRPPGQASPFLLRALYLLEPSAYLLFPWLAHTLLSFQL